MILQEIANKKRDRVSVLKKNKPIELVKQEALNIVAMETTKSSFYNAICKKGLSIIGEFKQASPSTGKLDVKLNKTERIDKYINSVDAISILTEEDYFLGSTKVFEEIRCNTDLPLLRKDFIIDPYQIYESKVIGANCILLIAALLNEEELISYYKLSKELNIDVLLEIHNKEELAKALYTESSIIGINNRNLNDFSIDLKTTLELRPLIPNNRLVVSESGIFTSKDIEILKQTQIDAILIGRALMESESPDNLAKELKKSYDT